MLVIIIGGPAPHSLIRLETEGEVPRPWLEFAKELAEIMRRLDLSEARLAVQDRQAHAATIARDFIPMIAIPNSHELTLEKVRHYLPQRGKEYLNCVPLQAAHRNIKQPPKNVRHQHRRERG